MKKKRKKMNVLHLSVARWTFRANYIPFLQLRRYMGDKYVQRYLDSREAIEGDLEDGVASMEDAGGHILGGIDLPIRINNG